tara:strand:- start:10332 stop:10700 length:369 start_codon:yes stop_codon:yes gene_type:complete
VKAAAAYPSDIQSGKPWAVMVWANGIADAPRRAEHLRLSSVPPRVLVKLGNHNDLLGKPGCGSAVVGSPLTRTLGVYGYVGLPTAWLAWQLQGSSDAGAAFRRDKGEFFSARAWSGQASNVR